MPEEKEKQAKKTSKKATEKKQAPSKEPAAEKKPAASTRYIVTAPLLNIREKASLSSKILSTLSKGEQVEVSTRTPQGFGKLADRDGYIALEFAKAEA